MPADNLFPGIRAAVLDMDGTLYPLPGGFAGSPLPGRLREIYVALIARVKSVPPETAAAVYDGFVRDEKVTGKGVSSAVADYLEYPGGRPAILADAWGQVDPALVLGTKDAAPAQAAVRGARRFCGSVYLVTGAPRPWMERVLRALGLEDAFDGTYALEDYGNDKSVAFSRVLALGFRPEEVLSVGDQEKSDILPAVRMGMRGLLVSGPEDLAVKLS